MKTHIHAGTSIWSSRCSVLDLFTLCSLSVVVWTECPPKSLVFEHLVRSWSDLWEGCGAFRGGDLQGKSDTGDRLWGFAVSPYFPLSLLPDFRCSARPPPAALPSRPRWTLWSPNKRLLLWIACVKEFYHSCGKVAKTLPFLLPSLLCSFPLRLSLSPICLSIMLTHHLLYGSKTMANLLHSRNTDHTCAG